MTKEKHPDLLNEKGAPFIAPTVEMAPEDVPSSERELLQRYANWTPDFVDPDPMTSVSIRRIIPDAAEYLSRAGHFSQRDIRFLIEHMDLQIDPKDHVGFYDAFLDRVEPNVWLFAAMELEVVNHRLGTSRNKKNDATDRKRWQIAQKLPLKKLGFFSQDEESVICSGLISQRPPADLVLGVFALNGLAAHSEVSTSEEYDELLVEAMVGPKSLPDRAEELKERFHALFDSSDWLGVANLMLETISEDFVNDTRDVDFMFPASILSTLKTVASELTLESPLEDFEAISILTDLLKKHAVESVANGGGILEQISLLEDCGFPFDESVLTEDGRRWLASNEMKLLLDLFAKLCGLKTRYADACAGLEAEIAEAVKARRFADFSTLGTNADIANQRLKKGEELQDEFIAFLGSLGQENSAEVAAKMVDLDGKFVEWLEADHDALLPSFDQPDELASDEDDEIVDVEEVSPDDDAAVLSEPEQDADDAEQTGDVSSEEAVDSPDAEADVLVDDAVELAELDGEASEEENAEPEDEIVDHTPDILEAEPEPSTSVEVVDEVDHGENEDNDGAVEGDDYVVGVAAEFAEDDKEYLVDPSLLMTLMERDLTGAAHDFAALLESENAEWPIEASVLRAAAAGRARLGDYSSDSQQFASLAQQAVSSVDSEMGGTVLLGALMRPAIMQNSLRLRGNMASLAQGVLGSHLKEVGEAIEALGFDFQPDADELASISGLTLEPQDKRLAHRLNDWVDATSKKRSRWDLATGFMQYVASANGLIGRTSAAINEGAAGARALAEECVETLSGVEMITDAAHEYVAYIGKPNLQFHSNAAKYLDRVFGEAVSILSEWLAATARKANRAAGSEEWTRRTVKRLRTRLDRAKKGIASFSNSKTMTGAVARWLIVRLDDTLLALDGKESGRFSTVREALVSDRYLLDSATRRAFEDKDIAAEELIDIAETDIYAPEVAFFEACRDGAFEVATALSHDYNFADGSKIDAAVKSFTFEWGEKVKQTDASLRDLSKVDYSHQDKIERHTKWCGAALERIDAARSGTSVENLDDIPGHYGFVHEEMEKIAAFIQDDQKNRIAQYRKDENALEADALVGELSDLSLEMVEDRIAQLRDGGSAATVEVALQGLMSEFSSTFLPFAENADWPQSQKAFEAAFSADGPLFVDEDRLQPSVDLMSQYLSLRGAIPKGAPSTEKIKNLFEEFGFQDVRMRSTKGAKKIGGTKSWALSLDARILEGEWFIPPTFGSGVKNGFDLILVSSDTLPESIMPAVKQGQPCVLLLAGVANSARRRDFAERLRANAIPAMLIDEALVAFAAVHRTTRIATLLDCGLPYGRFEPYTTDAGRIPPEMFFGRGNEIREIMSPSADGCLVYGGRQLGKSALLNQVATTQHNAAENRIVVRREVMGLGNSENASEIWVHLNDMLSPDGVVKPASRDADAVCRDIRAWLHERPAGQIVCMFDETDHFMAADTKDDYPQLSKLKQLMEDTNRSFKVVFAGLHNVKRMLRQPNSPLAHLGRAICIGPLNRSDDDKRAAHELVIAPMRAAGFRFESMDAVEKILAWANFYPSLVQEYAKGLLSTLHGSGSGRRYSLPEGEPLWVIPTDSLFDHSGFEAIEAKVREKFHLTLELDPRYALVAYTLAYLSVEGDEQRALHSGLKAPELLEHAKVFWPKGSETPSAHAFDALLDELFDLGVLGRIPIAGTKRFKYLLRTSQVAAMLGSREDVDHALVELSEKEPSVAYDRTLHRRRYSPTGGAISAAEKTLPYCPLTDFALERLLDRDENSVKMVCGLKMLGLAQVSKSIVRIAEMGRLPGDSGNSFEVLQPKNERDIRHAFDRSRKSDEGMTLILFAPENVESCKRIIRWMGEQEAVLDGRIRPIIMVEAGNAELREEAIRAGEVTEFLSPWGMEMLRMHLNYVERPELDGREMRERILSATGGIPADVVSLVAELVKAESYDRVFDEWRVHRLVVADYLSPTLTAALTVFLDVRDMDEFQFLDELIRSEAKADLATLGPDMHAIGFLSNWEPERFTVTLSALGRLCVDMLLQAEAT